MILNNQMKTKHDRGLYAHDKEKIITKSELTINCQGQKLNNLSPLSLVWNWFKKQQQIAFYRYIIQLDI